MRFLLVNSIFLLTHCAVAEAANNAENVVQSVNYCDLTKNPSALSGKRIRVRAIYSYMFEFSRLKPPACCGEADVAVWVDFSEEMDGNSKKLFHKFPKGMGFVLATFEGVFQSGGPFGHGGYRFKLAVDKIEALESKANPSPGHRPAWIPNCEASNTAECPAHPVAPVNSSSGILCGWINGYSRARTVALRAGHLPRHEEKSPVKRSQLSWMKSGYGVVPLPEFVRVNPAGCPVLCGAKGGVSRPVLLPF